jgi:large repetitive protein
MSALRRVVALAVLLVLATCSAAFGQTKAYPLLQQQTAKLSATGATGAAKQGAAVAISADGNTAIVGGPADNSNIGGAWIYVRNGNTWTQQGGELIGTGGVGTPQQGASVAISGDGNTVVIGGPFDNGNAGAVWVFTRSAGEWTQQGSKLLGSGAAGGANQGQAVALSADGNTAIVGGPSNDGGDGGVWIFTRSGSAWSQQGGKLLGSGITGDNANEGGAVAISGDGNTILFGSAFDNGNAGAFWFFTRSGITWSQVGSKMVSTGATGAAKQGSAVALSADGRVAAIGGPNNNSGAGAVWFFTQSSGMWTQQGVITAAFTDALGGAQMGSSMAISGDGAVIASGGVGDNSLQGAVFIFERTSVTSWIELGPKLVPSDASSGAKFGSGVGLSSDGNSGFFGATADSSNAGAAWPYNTNIFFGSVNVGTPATQTITVQAQNAFTVGTTPGIRVVTQGVSNLDFTMATSQPLNNNCHTGGSFQGQFKTCSITIQFTPTAPGIRTGAIQFFPNEGNNVQVTVYFYGVGLAPQVAFSTALIDTVAGDGISGYSGDNGPAFQAELASPYGVSLDAADNLYIADYGNSMVREVSPTTGVISKIAGTADTTGSMGDGGAAASATFDEPETPVLDGAGNMYLGDIFNNKVRVINPTSGTITTYAGNLSPAFQGDGGVASSASLFAPFAVLSAPNGDLYIADTANNVVRRVSAFTGIITTVAGNNTRSYGGDGGPATSASFNHPAALVMDVSGNLYISDDDNNLIREVAAGTGTVTTIVGDPDTNSGAFSGDGGPASGAQLNDPQGLALDPGGNLYITDSLNNAVRKVSATTGLISSIAGNGNAGAEGYSGDGGQATAGLLAYPDQPGFDAAGDLFFGEYDNNVVRIVGSAAPLNFGSINVGTSSDPQDVTVSNNGNATLTFSSIGASGNFNLDGPDTTCTSSTQLAPGQSCVLGVVFAPVTGGEISGNVTMLDNSGGGTQIIALSGVGALVTPAINLTVQPQSANENQSVTFTAVLNPIPVAPRGTVEFCDITNQDNISRGPAFARATRGRPTPTPADGIFGNCDGGTLLGSGNVDETGTASFATSGLSSGAHTIIAVYSGNAGANESLSNTVSETVSSLLNTTTTLSANPNPASTGQTVTFTAAVSPAPTGSPLGSVSFCLGSLDAVTRLAESNAASASRTVRRPGFSRDGNGNPCGGATLLSTVNIDGSGSAVFATASLSLGTNIITAIYSGNAGFAFSISNTISEVISNATITTTALTVSPNPANAGQTVTLTAKVTPIPTGTPLGSVNFCQGGTDGALRMASARPRTTGAARVGRVSPAAPASEGPCGSGSSLNETGIDSTGTATFSSSDLSSGSLILTAVYSGNATSTASTSDPVTEVINPAFTVTAPQTPFDVPEGGSVQITVTVPPLGGSFTNAVTLSATGLPPGATATFNPPMVTPGSAGASTIMTVQLAGGKSSASHVPSASPAGLAGRAIGLLAGLCMLAGILAAGFGGTARRRFAALAILFVAVSGSIVLFCACSGGFAGGAVTPKGVYVITVTGTSGSLQASTTVNLVVD